MEMKVTYKGGKRFVATTRGHQLTIDQPKERNGSDRGMTPPELFIASLGSCIGVYIVNYCKNVGLNPNDMIVSIDWVLERNPSKISEIKVEITVPKIKDEKRKNAFIRVAHQCTIHKLLIEVPKIGIELV